MTTTTNATVYKTRKQAKAICTKLCKKGRVTMSDWYLLVDSIDGDDIAGYCILGLDDYLIPADQALPETKPQPAPSINTDKIPTTTKENINMTMQDVKTTDTAVLTATEIVSTILTKYAVSDKATGEAYGDLRDLAGKHAGDAIAFTETCLTGEDAFMVEYYSKDPEAVHTGGKKAGQWKFRKYLPMSYSTAKSVLRKAIEAGIDMTGLGKSELEKLVKAATEANKPEQTTAERVDHALDTLIGIISKDSGDDAQKRVDLINYAIDKMRAVK